MIDVEAHVFNYVYPFVIAVPNFPAQNFKSMYVPNPSSFPFATLMEMDNVLDTKNRSSAIDEEYAIITYEANSYAMDKFQCRAVADAIDRGMISLNFARLSMQFIPNLADNTIFRITARYQAVADGNLVIYRR